MRKEILLVLLIIMFLEACVSNKQVQYMQKDDVSLSKNVVAKDTILRSYIITNYEYHIQSEDVLSIQFKSLTDPEYDFLSIQAGGLGNAGVGAANMQLRGYLVDEEGKIEFPVVGEVEVAGLTVYQAQNKIQAVAEKYLKSPVVDVRLLNFRFTVLGEVGNQGVITSFNNRTSILEAIGLAGGLDELADRSNIKLIRQEGRDAHVFYINLLDENFVSSEFYYMNQNDIIIVPPLKQRPFRKYFSQNLSIIVSSMSFLFLVYGLIFAN